MKRGKGKTSGKPSAGSIRKKQLGYGVSKPSKKTLEKGSSSGSRDEFYRSHWGNMRTKAARVRFKRWLDALTSADCFLTNKRAAAFYMGLNTPIKNKVIKKLREVDPEGLKRVRSTVMRIKSEARRRKALVPKSVDLKESTVAVRKAVDVSQGVSVVRFMDMEGLKGVIAICRAAGYTPDETAAMVGMDPNEVNSLVSDADIRRAAARMPDAVRMAADQIVMRDLLAGEVTDRTEKADRIVDRRTKHAIAAHAEKREDRKTSVELETMRKKHWQDRFGVEVEVEVTSSENGEEEKK